MADDARPVDVEMLDLALSALRDATGRVAAAPAAVARAMYAPLTEATWWVLCIDEELDLTPGYRSRRNTDDQGKVAFGLRYVRSLLGHHRFFAAKTAGGLTFPVSFPIRFETYPAWLPTDELRTFEGQERVRPYYTDHVAERAVLDPLADADAWFMRARSLLVTNQS